MKVFHALPVVASAADDSSTLLSLNVQATLETGVDHLLDAVCSRNVTQMSSLLQSLVEETISSEAPYQLDGDVKAALEVIKNALLGDIRDALKESHCYDQSDLHNQMFCFKGCEDRRRVGAESCKDRCDGELHKTCRFELLELYKSHIDKCRALDAWVLRFTKEECPVPQTKCCLLSHNTWNCNSLCAGTISTASVDTSFGAWLQDQIAVFTAAYKSWTELHAQCSESHKIYVEKDAKCDCEQARCESQNCAWDSCQHMNCEISYQSCWKGCQVEWDNIRKEKECLEKDRKIDWSATEKIECYVNVLLEKPTEADLVAVCGDPTCYNVYREQMYKKCNEICVEVDFTNERAELRDHDRLDHVEGTYSGFNTKVKDQTTHREVDQDVTGEGKLSVKTKHRGEGDTKRCTSHLDIDYLDQPCCNPCEVRPSRPCEGEDEGSEVVWWDAAAAQAAEAAAAAAEGVKDLWGQALDIGSDIGSHFGFWLQTGGKASAANTYMWLQYHQYGFLSQDPVDDFSNAVCYEKEEHSKVYAYNLCQCYECDANPVPPEQVCTLTTKNACHATSYGPASYDYSMHKVKVDCNAISHIEDYGAAGPSVTVDGSGYGAAGEVDA